MDIFDKIDSETESHRDIFDTLKREQGRPNPAWIHSQDQDAEQALAHPSIGRRIANAGAAVESGVMGANASLASSMDTIANGANDVLVKMGVNIKNKPAFFKSLAQEFQRDKDYYDRELQAGNASAATQLIGRTIGSLPEGMIEWTAGVPLAVAQGAAEAHAEGKSAVTGGIVGGAKRYVLGKLLRVAGNIENPVARRAAGAGIMGGAAIAEGASPQQALVQAGVGALTTGANPEQARTQGPIAAKYGDVVAPRGREIATVSGSMAPPDASLKSPTAPEALPFIRRVGTKTEVHPASTRTELLNSFRTKTNDPTEIEKELLKAGFSKTEAAKYSTDFVPATKIAQPSQVQIPQLDPAKAKVPGTFEYDIDQYIKRNGGTVQETAQALTLARSTGTQSVQQGQTSEAGISIEEKGEEAQKKLFDLNLPAQAEETTYAYRTYEPQTIHQVGVYRQGSEVAHDADTRAAIEHAKETGKSISEAQEFLKSLRGPEVKEASPLTGLEAEAASHLGMEDPHANVERTRKVLNSAAALSKNELDSVRKITGDSSDLAKTLEWSWNQGSVPQDPQLREAYVGNMKEAAQRIQNVGRPSFLNRAGNKFNKFQTADYNLDRLELAAGQPLRPLYHDMLQNVNAARQVAPRTVVEAIKKAGVDPKKVRLSSDDVENMRQGLFTGDRQVLDKLSPDARRVATALQSVFANYAERVRAWRFDRWNKYGAKPSDVPADQADNILEAGRTAQRNGHFDEWIKGQKWGTREVYYPSEGGSSSDIDLDTLISPGSLIKGEGLRAPGNDLTAGHTRTQNNKPVNGNPIDVTIRHIAAIDAALAVNDDMPKFWEGFKKANPTPTDAEMMKQYLMGMMGKTGHYNWLDRAVNKVFPKFWSAFFLDPVKNAWFLVRDMGRNLALGPAQLKLPGVASAISRMAVDRALGKVDEQAVRHFKEDFETRVKQDAALYHEVGRMDESLPAELKSKLGRASEIAGNIGLWADRADRISFWAVSHRMARDAAEAFQLRKIDAKTLRERLMLDSMMLSQRAELDGLLAKGDYDTFVRRYAEFKTDATNGAYEKALRSPLEQTPTGRAFAGIMVWPRLVYNAAAINGVVPMYQGWKNRNGRQFTQGLRNIVLLYAGMVAADKVYELTIGRKGTYSLSGSLLTYTPGSPGFGIMSETFNDVKRITQMRDEGKLTVQQAADQIAGVIVNKLGQVMPLGVEFTRVHSAMSGVKDQQLWQIVKSEVDQRYAQTHRGRKMNRSDYQQVMHFLFGGFKEPEKKGTAR